MEGKRSKAVEEWRLGRTLAAELARHTVSGVLIDNGAASYTLRWRAYFVGACVWNCLLNYEGRTEAEIRGAARDIDKIIERDNAALLEDGEGALVLNSISDTGNLVTESEWLTDVHDLCGVEDPDSTDFNNLLVQIGLSGWQRWEIEYLLALRMIDDAIRHHVEGQDDLAETLLLKALDATYRTEMVAHDKHRNTEYLFFKWNRKLAEKEKQLWIAEAKPRLLNERQKELAARPRANALTLAIREFSDHNPDAGWKELLQFLLKHPSLNCREIGETLEWQSSNSEHGEAPISGLPARLSRARTRRTTQ